jgi:hypothetical protein
MDVRKHFDEHGWVVLKNFFSPEEISQIHAGVKRSVKENYSNTDLLSNPYLSDLTILNPKIVSIVRELIGDTPTYIGDSSISFNDTVMSLHKDNPDRFNADAPDWQSPYSILRMGIYLQDYESSSGGLILRDKSHNYVSRWRGKIINVKTKPGDFVIWNLRTTHSGSARRYRLFPNLDVNPYINKYLPSFLFKPKHNDREALFLSYGKDDHHMKRYVDYLMTRKYALARWKKIHFTPEIQEKSAKAGLKLMDFSQQAAKINEVEANEIHQDIKF